MNECDGLSPLLGFGSCQGKKIHASVMTTNQFQKKALAIAGAFLFQDRARISRQSREFNLSSEIHRTRGQTCG